MTVREWIHSAQQVLDKAGIGSARLDATLLVSDELNQGKAWLLARDDTELFAEQLERLGGKLARRASREPLAYIRGVREFYGRSFAVTPDVLIPRPETESLIEMFSKLPLPVHCVVADIGTGSGAIATTLKLEHPNYKIIATDISAEALKIATSNAEQLHATVDFRKGNLCEPISEPVDVIVANLPYVDESWERSPETDFEPRQALFAGQHGLRLIKDLIAAAPHHLADGGYVLLEADPKQHRAIIDFATGHGLRHQATDGYAMLLAR